MPSTSSLIWMARLRCAIEPGVLDGERRPVGELLGQAQILGLIEP